MAQDNFKFPPSSGVGCFILYLESDEYLLGFRFASPSDRETPTLFEIIEDWLIRGDAIESCQTYEWFVRTVIDILDWWATSDLRTIDEIAFWPDYYVSSDGPGRGKVPGPQVPLGVDEFSDLPSGHRVFDPARFEQIKQAKLSARSTEQPS